MMKRLRVPIGIKIFAIVTSMLVLLTVLSYVTYDRISQVNHEMVNIADYLVPLERLIAEVNIHALEQEIRFERIGRLYEIEPLDEDHVQREREGFEEHGRLIDAALDKAIRLGNEALGHAATTPDIVEFARLEPALEDVKKEHQEFHDHVLTIVQLLQGGKKEEAHLLEARLEEEENELNREMEAILLRVDAFTERSVRTAAAHEQKVLQFSWILTGVVTVIGLLCASVVTVGLVRPVKRLIGGTREVEQGNLDVQVAVASRDEVGELADIFNTMVRQIRDKERIKATFGQYVDPRIVDSLIQQSGTVQDEGNRQMMTVFFSDVAHFSTISEMLTPEALVKLINQYLTLAVEPITHNSGVIDKFIGDAVMAFWGPPFADAEEHARLACYAALEQFDQLEKLCRRMPDLMGFRKGLPEVNIRVGLATGELVAGTIGSANSRSYTVIGEATEVAEQLEETNKIYGTRILMTEDTRQLAAEAIETRQIDWVRMQGEESPVRLFELLSRKGELEANMAEMRDIFEEGLRAYRDQDWDQAQARFETCVRIKPDDGPARVFVERVQILRKKPPGERWDGVWAS